MRISTLGELSAYVCGGDDGHGAGDGPCMVLMHGFGAGGDDLVGLAQMLRVPQGTRFVFPEAPLRLDAFGARAWWMIDPSIFEQRARGEVVDRTEEAPEVLPQMRARVMTLLEAVRNELQVPDDKLLLGGFSQGSMLALDVALHSERKPRALALLSTTLIARTQWQPRFASCAAVEVFQSHGTDDPLLPFHTAETLRDLLNAANVPVHFVPFRGGHEIPLAVLRELSSFVARVFEFSP